MLKSGLMQGRKVLRNKLGPGSLGIHLHAAISNIKFARLVHSIEEHQSMGTPDIESRRFRQGGDGAVDSVNRLGKLSVEQELECAN